MTSPRDGLTPLAYWQRCAQHDWNYCMSDDQRAWRRGREERRFLEEDSAKDPRLAAIWAAWTAYMMGKGELPVPPEDAIPGELSGPAPV
jgi:hypothetical protein